MGQKQGKAIPGAAIWQPRVEADGIFACTFNNGLDSAGVSQHRIDEEKADTLKTS